MAAIQTNRTCQRCGASFTPRHDRPSHFQRFCSRGCFGQQSQKGPKQCERCGVTYRPRSNYNRARFCSRACAFDRPGATRWTPGHKLCVTHGQSKTRQYSIWVGMIGRCFNPRNPKFEEYGARGITVCDEWRSDYMTFLRDVGERPSPQHTLDRIDNDGPYAPGNVRWATVAEQNRNQSSTRLITFRGETLCLTDWAARCDLTMSGLDNRLKAGWSLTAALLTPRQRRPKSVS